MENIDSRFDKLAAAYSTKQAAEYLNTTPGMLRLSRHTGELWGRPAPRFVKPGPRKVSYLKADLDSWLDELPRFRSTADVAMRKAS